MRKVATFLIFVILLVTILLFSTACDDKEFYVDYRLKDGYNKFKSAGSMRGFNMKDENLVILIKADLNYEGKKVYGLTTYESQTYIYIDSALYETKKNLVELVLFHELGHAKLNRGHTDKYSIMNPLVTHKGWPSENLKDSLLNELFKK